MCLITVAVVDGHHSNTTGCDTVGPTIPWDFASESRHQPSGVTATKWPKTNGQIRRKLPYCGERWGVCLRGKNSHIFLFFTFWKRPLALGLFLDSGFKKDESFTRLRKRFVWLHVVVIEPEQQQVILTWSQLMLVARCSILMNSSGLSHWPLRPFTHVCLWDIRTILGRLHPTLLWFPLGRAWVELWPVFCRVARRANKNF